MPAICPECGANLDQGNSCQEIFESFLVRDYTDPEYGQVHFLTVACFMIQHKRYSDEGLVWIYEKLRSYLDEGMTAAQIRRLAAQEADNSARDWKVTRTAQAAPLPTVAWSRTIADVADGSRDAESYRELVTEWARTTFNEMESWIKQNGE